MPKPPAPLIAVGPGRSCVGFVGINTPILALSVSKTVINGRNVSRIACARPGNGALYRVSLTADAAVLVAKALLDQVPDVCLDEDLVELVKAKWARREAEAEAVVEAVRRPHRNMTVGDLEAIARENEDCISSVKIRGEWLECQWFDVEPAAYRYQWGKNEVSRQEAIDLLATR